VEKGQAIKSSFILRKCHDIPKQTVRNQLTRGYYFSIHGLLGVTWNKFCPVTNLHMLWHCFIIYETYRTKPNTKLKSVSAFGSTAIIRCFLSEILKFVLLYYRKQLHETSTDSSTHSGKLLFAVGNTGVTRWRRVRRIRKCLWKSFALLLLLRRNNLVESFLFALCHHETLSIKLLNSLNRHEMCACN
jgi:hypothetical protein